MKDCLEECFYYENNLFIENTFIYHRPISLLSRKKFDRCQSNENSITLTMADRYGEFITLASVKTT